MHKADIGGASEDEADMDRRKKRLVVGMSGASGAILGVELLRAMRLFEDWETHLVITDAARRTIVHETRYSVADVLALATTSHPIEDIGASIASGTFKTQGMIIVPCSMGTVAGIAHGTSTNLLLRAADVIIKERRKLVLVARESPLSSIHLSNLQTLVSTGAIVLPPMLAFYNHPKTVEDMIRHVLGKILDIFDLELDGFARWREVQPENERPVAQCRDWNATGACCGDDHRPAAHSEVLMG